MPVSTQLTGIPLVDVTRGGRLESTHHVAACALALGHALPPAPLIAINQEYAAPGDVIRTGDEVALIPPVAGG